MTSWALKKSSLQYVQERRQSYQKGDAFEKLIQHYLAAKQEEQRQSALYTLIKERFAAQGLELPYAMKRWIQEP